MASPTLDLYSFKIYLKAITHLTFGFTLQSILLSDKTSVIMIMDNKTQAHKIKRTYSGLFI